MYHYETKIFWSNDDIRLAEDIDQWLNSFIRDESKGYYSYEIVGYVSVGNSIVITVKTWQSQFNKK